MNKKIRELEDNIIAILNESDVQIEVKRLIIADVLNLVTKESDKMIVYELNKEEPKNEKNKPGSLVQISAENLDD